MTILYPGAAREDRDDYAAPPAEPEPVAAWLDHRQRSVDAKLRGPIVLGAERVRLAGERCTELQREIDRLRHLRLNAPGWADVSMLEGLEQRATRLSGELHAERLALWADLRPLLESVGDAAVDRLRLAWLGELTELLGGGDRP